MMLVSARARVAKDNSEPSIANEVTSAGGVYRSKAEVPIVTEGGMRGMHAQPSTVGVMMRTPTSCSPKSFPKPNPLCKVQVSLLCRCACCSPLSQILSSRWLAARLAARCCCAAAPAARSLTPIQYHQSRHKSSVCEAARAGDGQGTESPGQPYARTELVGVDVYQGQVVLILAVALKLDASGKKSSEAYTQESWSLIERVKEQKN